MANPLVTSLYDWETGCYVPAVLSDPLVAAGPVDLITDETAGPSITRIPEGATPSDLETYAMGTALYKGTFFSAVVRGNPGLPDN